MQSTLPKVFFGGDAAFGPKNIITAVAHGHEAAISIDRFCHNEDIAVRPAPAVNLVSQKMGIHEWSFDNVVSLDHRHEVPLEEFQVARKSIKIEVERGFTPQMAAKEAQRCLNCDVQSVFTASRCIECDACIDICPMDALTLTENGEERDLRTRLKAPSLHPTEPLYVSAELKTGRVMVKDEDLCLHCSLCAERCPTGAWDMQKFTLCTTQAGPNCRDRHIAQSRKTA
jgi:formate dehydrogenase (NADP+) beta subunit